MTNKIIWIPQDKLGWILGKVIKKINEDSYEVQLLKTDNEKNEIVSTIFSKNSLQVIHPSHFFNLQQYKDLTLNLNNNNLMLKSKFYTHTHYYYLYNYFHHDNLSFLSDMHEGAVLHLLYERYQRLLVYTHAGPVLISLNPMMKIPGLYDNPLHHLGLLKKLLKNSNIYNNNDKIYYDKFLFNIDANNTENDDESNILQELFSIPKGVKVQKPHVYQISDNALSSLIISNTSSYIQYKKIKEDKNSTHSFPRYSTKNQSVIITGESGAGKTENSKHVLNFFIESDNKLQDFFSDPFNVESFQNDIKEFSIESHLKNVLSKSSLLLEIIGNAQTIRNSNSSRFGKYIKLCYRPRIGYYHDQESKNIVDESSYNVLYLPQLYGAEISTFLLEKSRICMYGKGEQTFHIFYQLRNFLYDVYNNNIDTNSYDKNLFSTLIDDDYYGIEKDINNYKIFLLFNQVEELKKSSISPVKNSNFLNKDKNKDKNIVEQILDENDPIELTNSQDFLLTLEILQTLGCSVEEIKQIIILLAMIIHMSNFNYLNQSEYEEYLSNKSFVETSCDTNSHDRTFVICPTYSLELLSKHLGVTEGSFQWAITTQQLVIARRASLNVKQLGKEGSASNVKALIKWLYSSFFDWIVLKINSSLLINNEQSTISNSSSSESNNLFIGILDIFGFEIFPFNSLEQLMINFTNERLQKHFTECIIKGELNAYGGEMMMMTKQKIKLLEEEQIINALNDMSDSGNTSFDPINSSNRKITRRNSTQFIKKEKELMKNMLLNEIEKNNQTIMNNFLLNYNDNQNVIDLISSTNKKKLGLLPILEELGLLNRKKSNINDNKNDTNSENNLILTSFNKIHLDNTISKNNTNIYSVPRFDQNSFIINHFAGPVTYNVTNFLEKNNDSLQEDLIKLFQTTENKFIKNVLFPNQGKVDELGYIQSNLIDNNNEIDNLSSNNDNSKSNQPTSRKLAASATVSLKFRNQLDSLIETLESTNPHYIKCIKPFSVRKPPVLFPSSLLPSENPTSFELINYQNEIKPYFSTDRLFFEHDFTLKQLRHSGLITALNTLPLKYLIEDFLQFFGKIFQIISCTKNFKFSFSTLLLEYHQFYYPQYHQFLTFDSSCYDNKSLNHSNIFSSNSNILKLIQSISLMNRIFSLKSKKIIKILCNKLIDFFNNSFNEYSDLRNVGYFFSRFTKSYYNFIKVEEIKEKEMEEILSQNLNNLQSNTDFDHTNEINDADVQTLLDQDAINQFDSSISFYQEFINLYNVLHITLTYYKYFLLNDPHLKVWIILSYAFHQIEDKKLNRLITNFKSYRDYLTYQYSSKFYLSPPVDLNTQNEINSNNEQIDSKILILMPRESEKIFHESCSSYISEVALKLQAWYKGVKLRKRLNKLKQWHSHYILKNENCIFINNKIKSRLPNKFFNTRYYTKFDKYCCIFSSQFIFKQKLKALKIIQSFWKKIYFERNYQKIINLAALKIQSFYRKMRCFIKFNKIKESSIIIQKYLRLYLVKSNWKKIFLYYITLETRATKALSNQSSVKLRRRSIPPPPPPPTFDKHLHLFPTPNLSLFKKRMIYSATALKFQQSIFSAPEPSYSSLFFTFLDFLIHNDGERKITQNLINKSFKLTPFYSNNIYSRFIRIMRHNILKKIFFSLLIIQLKIKQKLRNSMVKLKNQTFFRQHILVELREKRAKQILLNFYYWYHSKKLHHHYVFLKLQVTKLQSHMRKKNCMYKYHYKKFCIIKIQSLFRMCLLLNSFDTKKNAIIKIQSLFRKILCRSLYFKKLNSIIIIQKNIRRYLIKKHYFLIGICKEIFFSFFYMIKLKKQYQLLKKSTLLIQTFYRKHNMRSKYLFSLICILCIQTNIRSFLARNKFRKSKFFSIKLQSLFRMFLLEKLFNKKKNITIKLQSIYRQKISKRKYQYTLKLIILLQSFARKMIKLNSYKKLRFSAIKLQSKVRNFMQYKKYNIIKKKVILIQSIIRKFLISKSYNIALTSIIKIQANVRKYLKMIEYKKIYNQIIRMQSFIRKFLSLTNYLIIKFLIISLQKNYRMYNQLKKFKLLKNSSIIIQKYTRRFLCERDYIISIYQITKIQAITRRFIQKNQYNYMRIQCIKIQKNIRRFLVYKNYKQKKSFIILIQKNFRYYLLKKNFNLRIHLLHNIARFPLNIFETRWTPNNNISLVESKEGLYDSLQFWDSLNQIDDIECAKFISKDIIHYISQNTTSNTDSSLISNLSLHSIKIILMNIFLHLLTLYPEDRFVRLKSDNYCTLYHSLIIGGNSEILTNFIIDEEWFLAGQKNTNLKLTPLSLSDLYVTDLFDRNASHYLAMYPNQEILSIFSYIITVNKLSQNPLSESSEDLSNVYIDEEEPNNSSSGNKKISAIEILHKSEQNVLKCGWLKKKRPGGFIWSKRFVVLTQDFLIYYKNEQQHLLQQFLSRQDKENYVESEKIERVSNEVPRFAIPLLGCKVNRIGNVSSSNSQSASAPGQGKDKNMIFEIIAPNMVEKKRGLFSSSGVSALDNLPVAASNSSNANVDNSKRTIHFMTENERDLQEWLAPLKAVSGITTLRNQDEKSESSSTLKINYIQTESRQLWLQSPDFQGELGIHLLFRSEYLKYSKNPVLTNINNLIGNYYIDKSNHLQILDTKSFNLNKFGNLLSDYYKTLSIISNNKSIQFKNFIDQIQCKKVTHNIDFNNNYNFNSVLFYYLKFGSLNDPITPSSLYYPIYINKKIQPEDRSNLLLYNRDNFLIFLLHNFSLKFFYYILLKGSNKIFLKFYNKDYFPNVNDIPKTIKNDNLIHTYNNIIKKYKLNNNYCDKDFNSLVEKISKSYLSLFTYYVSSLSKPSIYSLIFSPKNLYLLNSLTGSNSNNDNILEGRRIKGYSYLSIYIQDFFSVIDLSAKKGVSRTSSNSSAFFSTTPSNNSSVILNHGSEVSPFTTTIHTFISGSKFLSFIISNLSNFDEIQRSLFLSVSVYNSNHLLIEEPIEMKAPLLNYDNIQKLANFIKNEQDASKIENSEIYLQYKEKNIKNFLVSVLNWGNIFHMKTPLENMETSSYILFEIKLKTSVIFSGFYTININDVNSGNELLSLSSFPRLCKKINATNSYQIPSNNKFQVMNPSISSNSGELSIIKLETMITRLQHVSNRDDLIYSINNNK